MALLRKDDVSPPAAPERRELGAILGRGSRFEGKLSFDGSVRIDGVFVGDIVSEGHLIVGPGATVEGNVHVGSAEVSGGLRGTLQTAGLLELRESAQVAGDLEVGTLRVDPGAVFDGTVKMAASA
jgi:cytoskeletal protein CcmA (bactofilin family)